MPFSSSDVEFPPHSLSMLLGPPRHNWSQPEAESVFSAPFADLILAAQTLHRRNFPPNQVQKAQLLSIKTGGCPEDCAYCSQSARFNTGVKASKLFDVPAVIAEARRAQANGATRFCMGAAWREPKDRDMDALCDMVRNVKALGLETCMTLGMLTEGQARKLGEAGLDYYNHNIDTSEDYYSEIITTRTFQDRLDTLEKVRNAGVDVCCGGIVGMGETRSDRIAMLRALATLPEHPGSVPVNALMPSPGTPLADEKGVTALEFVRTIATARIMMPASVVRLSAGRDAMSDELQALCFLAGANSIFVGEKLLTAGNPDRDRDADLFEALGIKPMAPDATRL